MADTNMAENCTASNPTDIASGQKDVYVQLVLSLALGISAFVAFCVSVTKSHRTGAFGVYILIFTDSPSEMEKPLCRAKEAVGCGISSARVARHLLWLDACAIQGDRTTSPCFCGA
jgi:hypothetical protein